jgi:hypothetical protein
VNVKVPEPLGPVKVPVQVLPVAVPVKVGPPGMVPVNEQFGFWITVKTPRLVLTVPTNGLFPQPPPLPVKRAV